MITSNTCIINFSLHRLVIKSISSFYHHYYSLCILVKRWNSIKPSIKSVFHFWTCFPVTIWWAYNKWERIINVQQTKNTIHKRETSLLSFCKVPISRPFFMCYISLIDLNKNQAILWYRLMRKRLSLENKWFSISIIF